MPKSKCYRELIALPSFEERLKYLQLHGGVGDITFASHRYLNQRFYTSRDWRIFRNDIILRDCGRDLAMPGYEIYGPVLIHHIRPISLDQLCELDEELMDPDNVVCVSHDTHNAIHYGYNNPRPEPIERRPNDTCPWKGH